MKYGFLADYFEGVAVKNLSVVDITTRSNQHEFGTTTKMRMFMGEPPGNEHWKLSTRFIYLEDASDSVVEDGVLTYYDTRYNQKNRRPEYRCYYPSCRVIQRAQEGDLLVIAKRRDELGMLMIIASRGSSAASQLEWLFGFGHEGYDRFSVRTGLDSPRDQIHMDSSPILEILGIEIDVTPDRNYLEDMLEKFGASFPPAKVFSEYARSTLNDIDPMGCADAVLMGWMEREEMLFRMLEKHIVEAWLRDHFTGEVDDFMRQSLSIQNRRKSRAGLALEDHLAVLMTARGVAFTKQARTENNSKPDFLFPSQSAYHDEGYAESELTMLGVKTTCKDRWRQILAEADRIRTKHLLTLEPAISRSQTDEMRKSKVQLVVPSSVLESYTEDQRKSIWTIEEFIERVSRHPDP